MVGAPEGCLAPTGDETELLCALRGGDEGAFITLVSQHQRSMLHVALLYVNDRDVAEEVVQETWLAVLQGLDRFEARSSLKTWLFRILVNRAKTRGQREGRSVPFSALLESELDADEPAVDPDRFRPPDAPLYPGGWRTFPPGWEDIPESHLLSQETRQVVETALAALPAAQCQVMTLRDVDGWTSEEVCNVLGITETNQRVLLHRARSKVRRALEVYLHPEAENIS